MASLYAQYLTERTDDLIWETGGGFATYRYVNDGKSVYIVNIYTTPKARRSRHAALIADEICKQAKLRGCSEVIGSVIPSTKNSTTSLQVLLAYGMTLQSAAENFIVFRKDIDRKSVV